MKFMKLGSKPDSFQSEGDNVRYVSSDLATDVIVTIGDVKFYLHKFPLLSKSARLQKLIATTSSSSSNEDNEIHQEEDEIVIPEIPGGPASFEICAKFCYGMTVTLNAYNVVAARCAAEFLEMHETVEKGNLVYKIEVFLNSSILQSWKDSIITLQTTRALSPHAEELKLTGRCLESIASRACIDTSRVEWSYTYSKKKDLDNGLRRPQAVPRDWWVEDLCDLHIDLYKRVIATIESRGKVSADVIGEALHAYATKRVPGFSKSSSSVQITDYDKYRALVGSIIEVVPEEKRSVSSSFLTKLLRASIFLGCDEETGLINRVGERLDEASLGDVMVYDVDLMLNLVEVFLKSRSEEDDVTRKASVAKLVDGYLAERSRDSDKLTLQKFLTLAEMVSSFPRQSHDGVYRAIDMFLKEHPEISKSEKKRICRLMDCRKLSVEACAHAVQNERLPMRVVVQVLFFEQARANNNNGSSSTGNSTPEIIPASRSTNTEDETESWDTEDIKTLRGPSLRSFMAILSISFPLIISSFLRPHASPRFLHLPRYLPRSPYRRFHRTAVSSNVHHHPSHRKPDDNDSNSVSIPTFQQAIQRLQEYWASVGCAVMQPSNTEVGAGTMNPSTFLRVLGPEPWNVAYVEPSIRPDDSRYGENPNRLQRHTQFQVILKPDPGNSQDLFINSLSALGIDVTQHDIRFVEDNWESPVLGAWGLGWEIWMDGMEITQFTYFQQAGSLQLSPVSVEITYGLERILMLLQEVDHFKKILYADGITYGELFLENEKEMSSYYLEHASVDRLQKHFDSFDEEARSLLALGLPIPAYDQLLKTSHAFNILDARGFVGVTERARYFGRMRSLARQCAQLWLKTRESLGHPLGVASEHIPPIHHGAALENVAEKVPEDPRSFIIEIGTEEMPPPDVINASEQLRVLVVQLLENQRLRHGVVKAFGTPRRLVVLVVAMSPKQLEEEVEVRGPPASKAFDDQGNPTKAADGFSRRYGVPLEKLYRKVDGKTEYVHARVTQLARLALEVLSEELPGILAKISFPKSMRWNSSVMFSRPVRWVMALHGDLVVPFCFAGNTSGNVSFGLRNTASATLLVDTAESYEDTMRNAGINIEIEERKKIILDKSNALAKSVNGRVVVQQNLLNEVANLVEAPVPLIGKFKESFLELPDELLTIVMQKHQKYFSLTDESGKLLPYFIAVANGAINEDVVRKGNEAVLRARYEDAKFFYGVDTRKKFSEFRDQLKGILFHEKLGTMLDKMNRLEKMVTKLCLALEIDEDLLPVVGEAASLALSDLATAVVTEFTALSGIMARHYALRDGYSEQIAEALLEITLPRFSGDVIPKTDAGMVLAIGDRLDSLVGLFAAGCQPSSTNDPFGLRRISYGLVQILVEKDKNVNFKHALEIAASVQPVKVEANTLDDVYQFVTRRLEQLLVDSGVSPEVVRSVLAERGNDPCLAARTAYEMEKLSKGEIFPKIVEAYSRPTRIVRGKDVDVGVEVDEAVFETSQEKELWSIYTSIKDRIHSGIGIEEFTEISTQLVEPLEDFFNNVFVMVEEEKVRKNRLALLNNIASLPSGIADLSFLPGF